MSFHIAFRRNGRTVKKLGDYPTREAAVADGQALVAAGTVPAGVQLFACETRTNGARKTKAKKNPSGWTKSTVTVAGVSRVVHTKGAFSLQQKPGGWSLFVNGKFEGKWKSLTKAKAACDAGMWATGTGGLVAHRNPGKFKPGDRVVVTDLTGRRDLGTVKRAADIHVGYSLRGLVPVRLDKQHGARDGMGVPPSWVTRATRASGRAKKNPARKNPGTMQFVVRGPLGLIGRWTGASFAIAADAREAKKFKTEAAAKSWAGRFAGPSTGAVLPHRQWTVERVSTARKNPYKTMADVRAANKAADGHFFDRGTNRFFGSKVEGGPYGGHYFVTSEVDPSGKKAYTVRFAGDNGRVGTVGHFHGYATKAEAVQVAKATGKRMKGSHGEVKSNPRILGHDVAHTGSTYTVKPYGKKFKSKAGATKWLRGHVARERKVNPASKQFIGEVGNYLYAVKIPGFDPADIKRGMSGLVDLNTALKHWHASGGVKEDWILTKPRKGQKPGPELRKWLKAVAPSEFFARWDLSVADDTRKITFKP